MASPITFAGGKRLTNIDTWTDHDAVAAEALRLSNMSATLVSQAAKLAAEVHRARREVRWSLAYEAAYDTAQEARDTAKLLLERAETVLQTIECQRQSLSKRARTAEASVRSPRASGYGDSVAVEPDFETTAPSAAWLDKMLLACRLTRFGKQRRPNVTRDGGQNKEALPLGLLLGLTPSYNGLVVLSKSYKSNKALTQLLCNLVRLCRPDFTFTSIQVNKNHASALHVDGSNMGHSLIITVGDYSNGGELYIHGVGKVNVKGLWYEFDGNVPHLTCPFEGERYSIIFYTNDRWEKASDSNLSDLVNLGFNLPDRGLRKKEYSAKNVRLKTAMEALPIELANCICERGPARRGVEAVYDDALERRSEMKEVEDEMKKGEDEDDEVEILYSDEDEETVMKEVLERSKSDVGRIDNTRAVDDADLEGILRWSFQEAQKKVGGNAIDKQFTTAPTKAHVQEFCEAAGCSEAVARKALADSGGDANVAMLRLLSSGLPSAEGESRVEDFASEDKFLVID